MPAASALHVFVEPVAHADHHELHAVGFENIEIHVTVMNAMSTPFSLNQTHAHPHLPLEHREYQIY